MVIITGGSSGIGKSIANILANNLTFVVNVDIRAAVEEHPHIHYFPCDVRSPEAIEQLYRKVNDSFGVPEVLILNAGIGVHERIDEGDPEKWQQVFDTNLMGPLRILRAFLPGMKEKGKGHIIFISSVSAGRAFPYGGVYSASKQALEVVAETLRLEVHPQLKVTVIRPGITQSNFFKNELGGSRKIEDFGISALSPDAIAKQIYEIITNEEGMLVSNLTIRPEEQEF